MAARDGLSELGRAQAVMIPRAELGRLADLRTRSDLCVVYTDPWAWVSWSEANADLAARMLALPGARLYEQRGDHWHRLGQALPDFAVPPLGTSIPLAQAIVPAPVAVVRPSAAPDPPARLRLVRDSRPRHARLLRIAKDAIRAWLDREPITTSELGQLRACRVEEMLWVLAVQTALPPIGDAERFWGETVFAPLGYRVEPAWPEAVLRQALQVAAGEWLVVNETGCQTLPIKVFAPLTRYGIARLCQD